MERLAQTAPAHYASDQHGGMDGGTSTALIAAIGVVSTAVIAAFWRLVLGWKQNKIDIQAQTSTTMMALLEYLKDERTDLIEKVRRQDRRITALERLLRRRHIEIPLEEESSDV